VVCYVFNNEPKSGLTVGKEILNLIVCLGLNSWAPWLNIVETNLDVPRTAALWLSEFNSLYIILF